MGYGSKLTPFIDNMRGNQPLIPEGPVMPEGTIKITENGTYNVRYYEKAKVDVQGGGPGPSPVGPVVKGDVIFIDGHKYRVLNANEDNTDVELMYCDLVASKFWNVEGYSPTEDMLVTFSVGGEDKTGLKYEGSTLDSYCNEDFFATLPADVKAAIIEQEVVQDMYNTSADEGTEDFLITGGTFGITYRIKKANDASIPVGNRKCYALSVADLIKYLGSTTTQNQVNDFYFGYADSISIYAWLRDANSLNTGNGCYVGGYGGGVNNDSFYNACIVRPAFHANLTSVSYSK